MGSWAHEKSKDTEARNKATVRNLSVKVTVRVCKMEVGPERLTESQDTEGESGEPTWCQ